MAIQLAQPPEMLVNFGEYWAEPERKRPRTIHEMTRILPHEDTIKGIWEVAESDALTGLLRRRIWAPNTITDKGAQYCLENLFAATSGLNTVMSIMAISPNAGSTYTTAALTTSGAITTIAVAAVPAVIPSGTLITVDYGGAHPETFTTSSSTAVNATSIAVTSQTPAFAHSSNVAVVPQPATTDNPSSVANAAYLSLVAGDYTSTPGVGSGNRTRTIVKKFPGASTTAGLYTEAYMCNANPIVSNSIASHIIVAQSSINSSTDQTFTFIIKL